MVRVNLIGKKRKETKAKSGMIIGSLIAYCGFLLYFFGSVVYVIFQLSSVNAQIVSVEQETQVVSGEMLRNNEVLNKYVLSKFILGKIESLNANRFRYKDYLDQIANFMPEGVILKNVDFSVKGWVSVLASSSNIKTLGALERQLTDETVISRSVFSSIYSETVSKDRTGGYSVKLQFEIRKNGGN